MIKLEKSQYQNYDLRFALGFGEIPSGPDEFCWDFFERMQIDLDAQT